MTVVATDAERYASPAAFAREVNLPLLGSASLPPLKAGASLSELLAASAAGSLEPIVENLAQTRQSLTLRSLLLAGFPHDPECFALGLALGRAWSRRGLKVAVVDLDGWNPTIVRGVGEPAEGFVDVLEYGCSFQRVAWEVVAGSLWVVGPGTHPLDETRLAEHPEWDRASRVFAARADVTLYVAPLLQRQGLTGRLSKRMDGVLLTASIDRVDRAELRDAFLELWGSDAPIIGCVAIEPGHTPAPAVAPRAAEPVVRREPVHAGARTYDPPREAAPVPSPVESRSYAVETPDESESALVAALEREVRTSGLGPTRRRARPADWLWGGLGVGAIVLASVAAWFLFVAPRDDRSADRTAAETRATGDESVLPAPDSPAPAPPSANRTSSNPTPKSPDPAPATTPASKAPVTAGLGGGTAGAALPGAEILSPPPVKPTLGASAPLTTAPPAEGKKYRVHVASFRSEDKVAPIVRDLRLKGLDAWFEPAADGSGWYRVFVGRFTTEDEAAAYASWLLRNRWVDRAHAFPSTSR